MTGGQAGGTEDLLEWDAQTYDSLPLPHVRWGAGVIGQLKTLPSAFNMARAGKLPPLIHRAIPGVERIRKIFERVGGRFK